MKQLIKNYLLPNNRSGVFALILWLIYFDCLGQVANYVNNGSFEIAIPSATQNPFDGAKYWDVPNVTGCNGLLLVSKAFGTVPYCAFGFQYPRTGNSFALSQFYCTACTRFYPRNHLKQNLKANTVYCGKYYVVNTNNNRMGIDSYGMYAGNAATIDTIKKCDIPLSYLNPQIQNTTGNVITDTLNWTAISGTFTANGTEKYLVLGNFKSNAATNTVLLNPPIFPYMTNDIYIDDVSLIEMELPAFAGHDTTCIPGTSVYIGRPSDVEIDESCRWYKLPITITPTTPAIDTAAGIWVSPVVTSTYVVRQQLWCSGVKWDTVVVYMNGVGLDKLEMLNDRLEMYPNPADEVLNLKCEILNDGEKFNANIINNLGQLVREEEIEFRNGKGIIKTDNLDNGVYFLTLKIDRTGTLSKRFVINR